jgi:hypothetical protein
LHRGEAYPSASTRRFHICFVFLHMRILDHA